MPETLREFNFYFFGFLISLSLGSFYVTLAERILQIFYSPERKRYSNTQKWKELLTKPSSCNHCGKRIPINSLVPVFGYFYSLKQCRYCHYQIPFHYPLTELGFGLFFLLTFYLSRSFFFGLSCTLLLGHLYISMYTDWKKFSLDYENLPFIFLFGTIANYFFGEEPFGLLRVYVFAGFLIFFLALYLLYPKGIGLGDVIFAPVFAYLAGHPWWMLFLNASYITALLVSFVLRDKTKVFRKTAIPMGFYFSLALILVYIAKSAYSYNLLPTLLLP